MRLWSLHPKYLDARGLVALWREALLAQAVIRRRTRGYTRHPQLERFLATASPAASIARYLRGIHAEAVRRGYRFDAARIAPAGRAGIIAVSRGQLQYEWEHLKAKLRLRSPSSLTGAKGIVRPRAHPLFRIVPGPVADWEVGHRARSRSGRTARQYR